MYKHHVNHECEKTAKNILKVEKIKKKKIEKSESFSKSKMHGKKCSKNCPFFYLLVEYTYP